jgi:hypothetical protein
LIELRHKLKAHKLFRTSYAVEFITGRRLKTAAARRFNKECTATRNGLTHLQSRTTSLIAAGIQMAGWIDLTDPENPAIVGSIKE